MTQTSKYGFVLTRAARLASARHMQGGGRHRRGLRPGAWDNARELFRAAARRWRNGGTKGIRMESRHIAARRIHTVAGAAGDEGRAHG